MSLASDWKKVGAQLLLGESSPRVAAELESAFYLGAHAVTMHYAAGGNMYNINIEIAEFREEMINGSS